MNAILGFSSLLVEEEVDKGSKTKFIKLINNSTHDLLYILTNIIDFSVIEAKQTPPVNVPFSLNNLLKSIHAHFTSELLKSEKETIQLTLQHNIEKEKELIIIGDASKLHQIFTNLLNNSIKFTETGCINIGCEVKDNEILFFVEDTGIGLSVEDQTIVFERFLKGKNAIHSALRGIGLGLTICKRLVEIMNGKIWLESVESKGTKVFFTLPLTLAKNF